MSPRNTTKIVSALAQYIIRARKRKGWTRRRLADETNIPYTTLRNVETAEQTVKMDELYLQAIAQAIDVPFDELRVLAGYLINDSETKEVQDRRIVVLLDAYPHLRKAITALLERGDTAEVDKAVTLLEVHHRFERERERRGD